MMKYMRSTTSKCPVQTCGRRPFRYRYPTSTRCGHVNGTAHCGSHFAFPDMGFLKNSMSPSAGATWIASPTRFPSPHFYKHNRSYSHFSVAKYNLSRTRLPGASGAEVEFQFVRMISYRTRQLRSLHDSFSSVTTMQSN